MAKIAKHADGGWVYLTEYLARTVDAEGDSLAVTVHEHEEEARAEAVAYRHDPLAVAAVVERREYLAPTRAEARAAAAGERDGDIDHSTVAAFGDLAALRAGEWITTTTTTTTTTTEV